MKIITNLFATFRVDRFKQQERDYPSGITLREVIVDVGVNPAEIGMGLVNGRHALLDHELHDGDTLSLPPARWWLKRVISVPL